MLNSASDYEFLDMSGLEGYVKGEIFPKRSNKRLFKYEDLLFLQEGKLERKNWRPSEDEPEKVKPYSRFELLGDAPRNKKGFLGATYLEDLNLSKFIDHKRRIESGIKSFKWKSKGSYALADDTEFMKENWDWFRYGDDLELDAIEATAGSPVKIRDLEAAYSNLGKLRRTAYNPLITELFSNLRYKKWTKGYDSIREESYETFGEWDADSIFRYQFDSSYTDDGEGWSSTLYEIDVAGAPKLEFPFEIPGKVWIAGLFDSEYENGRASNEHGEAWRDVVIAPYTGETSTLITMLRDVVQAHGRSFRTSPEKIGTEWESTSVQAEDFCLIVDNDFPATPPDDENEE